APTSPSNGGHTSWYTSAAGTLTSRSRPMSTGTAWFRPSTPNSTVIHGSNCAATASAKPTTAQLSAAEPGPARGQPIRGRHRRRAARSTAGLPHSTVVRVSSGMAASWHAKLKPSPPSTVGDDLPDHVAPRDPGHPAAAVRGRTRLVQPAHRRAQVGVAGGGAAVEHLPRRQL